MAKETDLRVFVALINNANQILVIKRSQHSNNGGQLGLPGGHLNEGETLEQAARREVSEEIGVEIDFATRSYIKFHADRKRTILVARMPSPSSYQFDLDPQEVECIYWMQVYEIARHLRPENERLNLDKLHKSLELALPVLMDLEPKYIVNAFTNPFAKTGNLDE